MRIKRFSLVRCVCECFRSGHFFSSWCMHPFMITIVEDGESIFWKKSLSFVHAHHVKNIVHFVKNIEGRKREKKQFSWRYKCGSSGKCCCYCWCYYYYRFWLWNWEIQYFQKPLYTSRGKTRGMDEPTEKVFIHAVGIREKKGGWKETRENKSRNGEKKDRKWRKTTAACVIVY